MAECLENMVLVRLFVMNSGTHATTLLQKVIQTNLGGERHVGTGGGSDGRPLQGAIGGQETQTEVFYRQVKKQGRHLRLYYKIWAARRIPILYFLKGC